MDSSSGASESSSGASGLQMRSSEEWWEYFGSQVRLLRSSLLTRSRDRALESDIKKVLNDCLELYTVFLGSSSREGCQCIISGRKRSSLEAAFMWLGGWRPTSAILLVFSIMGIESQRDSVDAFELHRSTPVLTERQLYSLNSLQAHTQQAEHDLSNQLGLLQMLVADQNVITAVSSRNWSKTRVAVEEKVSKLRDLLIQADSLRSQTLHELSSVLDPIQAAKCSIAAFELAFAITTFAGSLSGTIPSGSRAVECDSSKGIGGCKLIFQERPFVKNETFTGKREVADHHSSSEGIEPLKHFLEGSPGDGKGKCFQGKADCSYLQTPDES